MKIKEVPNEKRIYAVNMSNRDRFYITGDQKDDLLISSGDWIEVDLGQIIHKTFIVDIIIDIEKTQKNIKGTLIKSISETGKSENIEDNMPPIISLEKIQKLREGTKQLSEAKKIKEKNDNELRNEALLKLKNSI